MGSNHGVEVGMRWLLGLALLELLRLLERLLEMLCVLMMGIHFEWSKCIESRVRSTSIANSCCASQVVVWMASNYVERGRAREP